MTTTIFVILIFQTEAGDCILGVTEPVYSSNQNVPLLRPKKEKKDRHEKRNNKEKKKEKKNPARGLQKELANLIMVILD